MKDGKLTLRVLHSSHTLQDFAYEGALKSNDKKKIMF